MALSHFADKAHPPGKAELTAALGRAYPLWLRVQALVATAAPKAATEWGYTSSSTGWGLRLKQGKRVILYMTPRSGHFLASTALGERAIAAARQQRLPAALLTLLDQAPRYAEGRGVRLPVRRPADVAQVARIVALKLAT